MTKRELIQAIEMFDDEIDIELFNSNSNQCYSIRTFYSTDNFDKVAKIIISVNKPTIKCVEIK